jgi:hypothetical protein
MKLETITERDDLVIWKMTLSPGEYSHWHTDSCSRFTVIVAGDKLGIEFRDQSERIEFDVQPGTNGWDEPEARVHRAVNIGVGDYVEIVTFYRENASIDPQPTRA